MTDKPILFSAAMIRALLDGRKTQTRRVITKGAALDALSVFGPDFLTLPGNRDLLPINVVPGNRLWVREAWRTADAYDDLKPSELGGEEPISFEADGSAETFGWPSPRAWGRYRHGRYMPRWASRLTLTVTDVRVQRVQDISETDAMAEGVEHSQDRSRGNVIGWRDYLERGGKCGTARGSFQSLWNSLNAQRGYGWDANPWVAAYTFTVARQNIDQVTA